MVKRKKKKDILVLIAANSVLVSVVVGLKPALRDPRRDWALHPWGLDLPVHCPEQGPSQLLGRCQPTFVHLKSLCLWVAQEERPVGSVIASATRVTSPVVPGVCLAF